MAKQRAFRQIARNGSAIHGDEGLRCARRYGMEEARRNFLAHTCLAHQHNRHVHARGLVQRRLNRRHGA